MFKKEIEQFGFKGLKLYPPCGFEIDNKLLTPFYDFCNELHLPVVIHTGPSLKGMINTYGTFKKIKEISGKYKKINFVLAHAGILYIDKIIDDVKQSNNIYVDVSGFQKNSNNMEALKMKFNILQNEIPEKVLYGSDWPLYNFNCSQKKWIEKICTIDSLTDDFKYLLFTKNAENILNL